MAVVMFVDKVNTLHNEELMRRLHMSIEHVGGCLYRIKTMVSNVSNQSFSGLPSRHNITLLYQVKLPSQSYAFPR